MGRRPKRSAIVEKTSAPTNNPAKVPKAKVARSGRPKRPAWPLWKIPADANAGASRLVSAISYISKKAPNEMRATQDHRSRREANGQFVRKLSAAHVELASIDPAATESQ